MDEQNPGSEARERAAVAEVVSSVLRHDLRNRFSSIRNASYYLMRQSQKTELWKTDPRMEAFFQLIDRELASAEELLSNRGPLSSRDQRGLMRLREGVERAFGQVRIPATIRVERAWEERSRVEANAEDLALLTRCLLENAVEAMPEGGLLGVRTLQGEGGVSVLEVTDSGPGLNPEQQKKAFEPFMTTKPGHAGLGLCIVQRLALRSGAWVELQQREPQGLRVRVVFPAAEETGVPGGA
ncbi:ATP-binding protein [Hyalangium rubrum]|uniref:histidine kinase n=1 Tax=Hyalangium rubrum TaxID=3103134 RepID=A0ABU5GY15_9BACT|nr:ATP-binding protein [Hyalangium sp. s54d21]MDY7226065.1 ATP-binding protein [Hyalangium sp. s54d21]